MKNIWAEIKARKAILIKTIIGVLFIASLVNTILIGRHLHRDMGGIGLGISAYFDFASMSWWGNGGYFSQGYPLAVERALLLPRERWKTEPIYIHSQNKRLDTPKYCTADIINSGDAKYHDCKINGGGGYWECKLNGPKSSWYRPNCRGVTIHTSLWEDVNIRHKIKYALFHVCETLPNLAYLKDNKNEMIAFGNESHKYNVDPFMNTIAVSLHYTGCSVRLPKVTEFYIQLSDRTHRHRPYDVSPNRQIKIIKLTASGSEKIIKILSNR